MGALYLFNGVKFMKSKNLLSLLDSAQMDMKFCSENNIKIDNVLSAEKYIILKEFCAMLYNVQSPFNYYDGYFLNCSIPHTFNTFDMLRLSGDAVVNIELKTITEFSPQEKWQQIENLLYRNYYYLRFLNKSIFCFCYVLNDGLYRYDRSANSAVKVGVDSLFSVLAKQEITLQYDADTSAMFDISKYLVSPFRKTDRFARGEYFLTFEQDAVCRDILQKTDANKFFTYCISADAGTGKTLLIYDIARRLIRKTKKVLILHGANLNDAQMRLKIQHGFDICGVKEMTLTLHCAALNDLRYDLVIVDEAQRFAKHQIDFIVNEFKPKNTPVIFAYDPKQHLRKGEGVNVYEYLNDEYDNIKIFKARLDKKIRNSKEIIAFCNNLFKMGTGDFCERYNNITVEYFSEKEIAKAYLKTLEFNGFKSIGFKGAKENLCSVSVGSVIGQEFDKVAVVMDNTFFYDEQNRLAATPFKNSNINPLSALFQIITRAKSSLKIVVLDNKSLYNKIMKIKYNRFEETDIC